MIIWFDRDMVMHVDKKHDANNSFALAKYVPEGYNAVDVMFKANAVVSGHTLLLTDPQVTYYARRILTTKYCSSCSSTVRKHFFNAYLPTIEGKIADNLRNDKKYKGDIKLRFRVGKSTINLFPDYLPISAEDYKSCNGYYYSTYVILEKKLQ